MIASHTRVERLVAEQRDQHRREARRPPARCRGSAPRSRRTRRTRTRTSCPSGKIPSDAEDPQHDARARAHDQRRTAAGRGRSRRPRSGCASGSRPPACRRPAARPRAPTRADPLPVEQHVDREHDDQDQRDRAPRRAVSSASRVNDDELARALRDAVAERLERGLAGLGDLDVDARCRRASPGGRRASSLASSTIAGHVVAGTPRPGRRPGWPAARRCRRRATQQARYTAATASPRGKRAAPQQRHDGLSSSAISAGDDEQQQHRPGRARERPERRAARAAARRAGPSAARRTGATRAGGSASAARIGRGLRRPPRAPSSSASAFGARASHASMRPGGRTVRAARGGRSSSSATSSARAGRRALRELLPGLREELRARLRRRQRRERRRRHRHHAEERRRAVRGRRRRDHARQPHLPPPRDLALPRRAARHPAPGELPAHASRAAARASSSATACALGVVNLSRQPVHAGGHARRSPTIDDGAARGRAAPTTCSSTCTPRRRARRSRWAGTSTAA